MLVDGVVGVLVDSIPAIGTGGRVDCCTCYLVLSGKVVHSLEDDGVEFLGVLLGGEAEAEDLAVLVAPLVEAGGGSLVLELVEDGLVDEQLPVLQPIHM